MEESISHIFVGVLPLLLGYAADKMLGDPEGLPHPVVLFGKMISGMEHRLNKGSHRLLKGAVTAVVCIAVVGIVTYLLMAFLRSDIVVGAIGEVGSKAAYVAVSSILVFYCLAGTTLAKEVKATFRAVDESTKAGRRQLSRIVGRDTSELTPQEIRTAALETLAENMSDGVVAPLFWYLIGGLPLMMAYKMVNTLDSMIGYRTQRYLLFGRWAARIDDFANYIPARLTALIMAIASVLPRCHSRNEVYSASKEGVTQGGNYSLAGILRFIAYYGSCHASPNSGWPESALAAILNCRFGGPHYYFGEYFHKPYIGYNDRQLTNDDLRISLRVSLLTEVIMVAIVLLILLLLSC